MRRELRAFELRSPRALLDRGLLGRFLAGGLLGTVRFTDEGKLDLPKGAYW